MDSARDFPISDTLDSLADGTNTSEIMALDVDPCHSDVLQWYLHLVDKVKINQVIRSVI